MTALIVLLAGAVGLYAFSSDRVRKSGTVQLKAGVPYQFEIFWPKVIGEPVTAEMKTEMLNALGLEGKAPTFRTVALGTEILYTMTPPVTVSVPIDTPLVGYARLLSITRMDGKDWNAP